MASKDLSRESQVSVNRYVPATTASRSSLVDGAAPFLYKTASIKTLPPMIFHKTGFRIKQLISHRRSRTFDDGEISTAERERRLGGKPAKKHSKRRSWIGNNKTSIDAPFLQNSTEGNPRQKDVTAQSSSSSLCSCGCEPNDSQRSLFSEPRSPKILYLQPSTVLSGDAKLWCLIFPEESNSLPSSKSTFDLLEALALQPTDDKTPTPTIKNTRDSFENQTNLEIYEEVVQLNREADETFKDVRTAVTPNANESAMANEDAKEESAQVTTERQRHVSKKQRKVPITRSNNLSKAKRTRSTKKRGRLLDIAASGSTIPPISGSPSLNQRWTFIDVTDNISDIFGGKMFGKMEVNELIDTTRIGRIPHSQPMVRMQELKHVSEHKNSVDIISSHETDNFPTTSSDPFSPESPPLRLSTYNIVSTPPDPQCPPTSGSSIAPVIPPKSGLRNSKRDSAIYVENGTSISTHPERTDISMPPRPFLRQRSRSHPLQPTLPTIQEVTTSPLTHNSKSKSIPSLRKPSSAVELPASSSNLSLSTTPEKQLTPLGDKHILLNSTPFTLTSPHFIHGNIRLSRGQKRTFKSTNSPGDSPSTTNTPNSSNSKNAESGLDWTAFQIAISGGAGNYLMGGMDPEAEAEGNLEEVEEIRKWWKEFGFEGIGKMVDGKTAGRRRKKSKLSSADVGISYEMDSNTNTLHNLALNVCNSSEQNPSIKGKEPDRDFREDSLMIDCDQDSLPPSPMDDIANLMGLSLEKGKEGVGLGIGDGEVVPMGFNLSHDLDDYLKWEATRSVEGIARED